MGPRLSCFLILLCAACASSSTPPEPAPEPIEAADLVPITTSSEEALDLYYSGRRKAERFHQVEARRDLTAAVDLDPGFAMAWLQLGWVAPSREAAEQCMARAEEGAPNVSDAEKNYVFAAIAAYAGRIERAREHLLEVVARYPEDPRASYQLGLNYWATDDPAVLTNLRESVRLDPSFDSGWNMLGYAAANYGEIDEAVEAHRKYVELLPDEPNAHDSFAETLLKAGRYKESIEQYEKALELDPSFVWSRVGIGHNLLFLKRHKEAHETYERALAEAKTPRDAVTANDWLIVLGVYAGRTEDALAAAERGVGLAAELGDYEAAAAIRTLARIQLLAGQPARARETAGQSMARLGESATPAVRREITHSVLRLMAEIDLSENDFETASRRVKELSDLSETLWEVRLTAFTEGLVALERGAARKALTVFEGAPIQGDPRYLFYLAEAKLRTGDREAAAESFEMVVNYNSPSLGHALVFASARSHLAVLRYR